MPLKGRNELERFVDKYGYNKIWTALEVHFNDNNGDFDIDTYSGFVLDNMYLKFTRDLTVHGCRFEFDSVFEVCVHYTDKGGDEQNQSQWFSVHCVAEVDNILISFDVTNIAPYEKIEKSGNTTHNFVPVISKKQMDAEAKNFLRAHYPQALREPVKVPIDDIARDMGLNLELGYMLSDDFSFFGEISFSDTKTRVFNAETGQSCDLDVTRGTILIDPEVFWGRSAGCENFTIAHEVVHWEKHKLFADIKRLLYKGSYVAHRCPKPSNILPDSDDAWGDEEWLEWQANGIGARILMPKETLPAKIDEIITGFSDGLKADKTEFYITLIDELADFYGTSRQTAKYRLRELGYDEVDDIQIHEYDFQAYTHEIDEYKAYYELCENAELRMLVRARMFAYADNHFVVSHKKCVEYDDSDIPHLTDFAWANISKCTLKFINVRVNIRENGKFSDILYRGKTYETFQKYRGADNNAAFEFARELAADFTTKAPEREKIRVSFCDRVRQILDAKQIGPSDFQVLTLLSRDTYYKLKKQDYKPAFETVIALCAGLDLDITVTTELLNKSGYSFNDSEAHNAYVAVITQFAGKSILVRNEFLRNLNIKGVRPLGEKDAE